MIALAILIGFTLTASLSGKLISNSTNVVHSQTIQDPVRPEFTPHPLAYRVTNLVSDLPGVAFIQDPLVVNPWGIAMTATSPFWLANNGTSTSSLYRGDVNSIVFFKQPGVPSITIPGMFPTGTVANGTADFVVTSGAASGPARFIFASQTGNISGWNPGVPAGGSTTAIIARTVSGHVYTGLAIGNNGVGNFLYAADFANGKIDVFDGTYTLQSAGFPFIDPTIPNVPGNIYHPFNIQNIGGMLYVEYAKVGPGGDEEIGPGNGFVRRFNTNGVRDLTFGIDNGPLNAPWGVVVAPASFGVFGSALLVGNFGEGGPSINAFNPTNGAFLDSLSDDSGMPLEIDELWGIVFGNGATGGNQNTLYFAAGTAEEEHGLFGSVNPVPTAATSTVQFSSDQYTIGEGNGSINVTVTRSGDVTGTSTVNIATFDESQTGHASQKSDYEIALNALTFKPGESSKTLTILLVDDLFVEGDEKINLTLSNPTGTGMGSPSSAEVTVIDNDSAPPTTSPLDNNSFFVRQQYLDFLGREADPGGLSYWTSQIDVCGTNAACLTNRRNAVSFAFFVEQEFQRTRLFTILVTRAAFGRDPLYGENALDRSLIGDGTDGDRSAFVNQFVNRNEFRATLDALTNAQYVDRLLANANLVGTKLFTANLSGAQEVPPNSSTATGRSSVVLNAAETGAAVNLSFSGLTSAQTAAHIHGPADPGVNAPILFPLPNGQVSNFLITLTAAQVTDLKAGKHYINVHSTNFPNGEIRGQYAQVRDRDDLVAKLNAATLTRAQVLRIIAESDDFALAQMNRAFILAEYFGYLRRDPDQGGFDFWLNNLNTIGTKQGMVCAFLTSLEYQQRFGIATHANSDCAALTP